MCPGAERAEAAVQSSVVRVDRDQNRNQNPEPGSRDQAGPERDLSAHCDPFHRRGGGGLPEAGGEPAEVCPDPVQRSDPGHVPTPQHSFEWLVLSFCFITLFKVFSNSLHQDMLTNQSKKETVQGVLCSHYAIILNIS